MEACSARISRKNKKRRQSLSRIIKIRSRHWKKAKTRGATVTPTGCGNVTSNDMFKSMEMDVRGNEIKSIEDDKKDCKNLMKI